LLLADQALKCGHDRLESFHSFRAGIEDALTDVVLVCDLSPSVRQSHGTAEYPLQVGTAPLRVRTMAGGTTELGEDFLSGHGERAGGAAAHPGFILRGLH